MHAQKRWKSTRVIFMQCVDYDAICTNTCHGLLNLHGGRRCALHENARTPFTEILKKKNVDLH